MKETRMSQAGKPSGASLQREPHPSHRILVVEDDVLMRQFITESLHLFGYLVDGAEDGISGWEALNAANFDLLITDNNMPRLTGIGLLKKLHAAHMALPVIMVTGAVPQNELAECPWLQPAAILVKPYAITELFGAVHDVLRVTAVAQRPA